MAVWLWSTLKIKYLEKGKIEMVIFEVINIFETPKNKVFT
jgi:hypothetical protein